MDTDSFGCLGLTIMHKDVIATITIGDDKVGRAGVKANKATIVADTAPAR